MNPRDPLEALLPVVPETLSPLADAVRVARRAVLDNLRERRRTFPRKAASCGSVFKRVPELFERARPPGRIIESCGFKGQRAGDAEFNWLHAHFIANAGRTRAAAVLELIRRLRDAVHARFGIRMETEVRHALSRGGGGPAHEACVAV